MSGNVTTSVIGSIEAEYRRYKRLAEDAMKQLSDAQLASSHAATDNSIATIAWHVAGNLKSRFTDFLTSDGEKPWRNRESEFEARGRAGRADVIAHWEQGWGVLWKALGTLSDADLQRTITIRGEPLTVSEALQRSLAHASYHVGQIVYVAKMMRGAEWSYLSIPPGESDRYNQAPTKERPPAAPAKRRAQGPFDVKMSPQTADGGPATPSLGRFALDKRYHGDLDAKSAGGMLSAGTEVKGSAGYVAIEHVTGTLHGREGGFALQHSGMMARGAPSLVITVVPDSGTGALKGLAGTMAIVIEGGKHSYDFEYTIEHEA